MIDVTDKSGDFGILLNYIKSSRGFDFSSYKRTTLTRRFDKRMQAVGVATYDEYQDYLEVHQDEFPQLFNTILINVTAFFRDGESWEYLRDAVVPPLLAAKATNDPVRVWVAGCASGEEACTIAILLVEAMGEQAFRERVKIYATDLDDDALGSSRSASYSESEVEAVAAPLREKYFERVNDRLVFDRELRRSIIFGRHNLMQDAPISRVDLLLCRNTLMYFNAEAQERILQRFHFALNEGGYLFLGRAETMLTHTDLFSAIDLKNRVFTKVPRSRIRERGFMFSTGYLDHSRVDAGQARLWDGIFESGAMPQIVLDNAGRLVLANERARLLFSVSRGDVGSPIQDLDVSYRPVELRSGIEQAIAGRRVVRHRDVAWTSPAGEGFVFDVAIGPVRNDANEIVGTSISFEDVTASKRLQNELQSFKQELETAYEEVQSTNEELQTTNEELQSTIEELETTNEELQSTNEELQTTNEELQSTIEELETTNEELQSTNEELETMNEELQSANEELETINEEMRKRSNELNGANAFLESILSGLRDGVVVLDGELQVLAWNGQSEDLWGLRADEVLGKHLLNLDIGLPTSEFRDRIRTCVSTQATVETQVEATNRRGRKVECAVTFIPLRGPYESGRGVIILTTCSPAA